MLHLLREELAEPLVEAAERSIVECDPDQSRSHALCDRKVVESTPAGCAPVVPLEDQAAVALDEHAENARLRMQRVVEGARVEACAGLRSGDDEQECRGCGCGRRYSERTSSAHSDIGT